MQILCIVPCHLCEIIKQMNDMKTFFFVQESILINKCIMKKQTNYLKLLIISCLLVPFFYSCDKDDTDFLTLSTSEKTLNYHDEYQIDATSSSDIEYTVKDDYHASVSETGLVKARFVGETNIVLNNSSEEKIFKLTVAPKYNLYPEPDVEFGTTKSSVIREFGSDYSESDSGIGYKDYSSAAPVIMFIFDDDDKLSSYVVMVKTFYSSKIVDFLGERYLPVGEEDDVFYFSNGLTDETTTMVVMVGLYNVSYWMILYSTYPPSGKSIKNIGFTDRSIDFDNLLKKLD